MTEVGDELGLAVTPDAYLTVRYAGASGDFNPIHLDDAFARSVGLPGKILHGLYSMTQLARAHTEAFGGPGSLTALSVEFRGMAVPEHELRVSGRVSAVADGVARTQAEVTQEQTKVIRRGRGEVRLS